MFTRRSCLFIRLGALGAPLLLIGVLLMGVVLGVVGVALVLLVGRVGVLLPGGLIGVVLLLLPRNTSGRSTSLLPLGGAVWVGVVGVPLLLFPLKNRTVGVGRGPDVPLLVNITLGTGMVGPLGIVLGLPLVLGPVVTIGIVGASPLGLVGPIDRGGLLLRGGSPVLNSTVPSVRTLWLLHRLRGACGLHRIVPPWGVVRPLVGPPLGPGVGGLGVPRGFVGPRGPLGLGRGASIGLVGPGRLGPGFVILLLSVRISLRLEGILGLLLFSRTLLAWSLLGALSLCRLVPLWRNSWFSRSPGPLLPLLLCWATLLGTRVMSAAKKAWNPLLWVLSLLRATLPCLLLPGTSTPFFPPCLVWVSLVSRGVSVSDST